MSSLLIVFIVFLSILLLNRLKLNLAISIALGTLLLAILSKFPLLSLLTSVFRSCTRFGTLQLLIIVSCILVMSRIMKETGQMDRIVRGFQRLTTDARVTVSVLPALIGILPMPGGALFSAPMVAEGFGRMNVSAEQKSAINYWFRHVWEYWWPLYPGVILAVSLLGIPTWHFSLLMFPMTLMTIGAGIFFLLRPLHHTTYEKGEESALSGRLGTFLNDISPIIVIVVMITVLSVVQAQGFELFKVLSYAGMPVLVGLLSGLAYVISRTGNRLKLMKKALSEKELYTMALLILAIMAFQGVLKDAGSIMEIRNELASMHISVLGVIILLPFLSGMITGIAIGFVGLSFPLLIPLIADMEYQYFLAYAALAYTSGYLGMMLSPVHLCFLVTKDYFKADFSHIYPLITKPSLSVFFFACAFFFLLSR